MDQRERSNEFQEALRAAMDGRLAGLWTATPGTIETFDAEKQIASVQPAIQRPYRGPDGTVEMLTLPLLLDCPVYFPAGGGVTLTFPVTKGDECLVVFASRCIDSWWQNGGVQPPAEFRMHDLSDGFAYVGFRSQPRKLSAVSTTKAQLRNDAGDTYLELDPAEKTIKAVAATSFTAQVGANTSIVVTDGQVNITAGGRVWSFTASGLKDGTKEIGKAHTHGGVQTGAGISGQVS